MKPERQHYFVTEWDGELVRRFSSLSANLKITMSNSALNFPLSLHFSSGGTTDKPLSFYGFLKDTDKYERCLRGKCRTPFDTPKHYNYFEGENKMSKIEQLELEASQCGQCPVLNHL